MNFWRTERVRLRALEPSDVEHFARWDEDAERTLNLDFVWPPGSRVNLQAWVEGEAKRRFDGRDLTCVIEDATGAAVGSINTYHCEPRNGTFRHALAIAREHRGRGYARDALTLILRYYFGELRYQKCTAPVYAFNLASVRLHESLGFVREGTLRRMLFHDGRYHDEHLYGITAEEFAAADAPRRPT